MLEKLSLLQSCWTDGAQQATRSLALRQPLLRQAPTPPRSLPVHQLLTPQQTPSLRLSPSEQVTSLQEAHKRIPAFWSLGTWPLGGGHSASRVVWRPLRRPVGCYHPPGKASPPAPPTVRHKRFSPKPRVAENLFHLTFHHPFLMTDFPCLHRTQGAELQNLYSCFYTSNLSCHEFLGRMEFESKGTTHKPASFRYERGSKTQPKPLTRGISVGNSHFLSLWFLHRSEPFYIVRSASIEPVRTFCPSPRCIATGDRSPTLS